jgi:hypothetical protein
MRSLRLCRMRGNGGALTVSRRRNEILGNPFRGLPRRRRNHEYPFKFSILIRRRGEQSVRWRVAPQNANRRM